MKSMTMMLVMLTLKLNVMNEIKLFVFSLGLLRNKFNAGGVLYEVYIFGLLTIFDAFVGFSSQPECFHVTFSLEY